MKKDLPIIFNFEPVSIENENIKQGVAYSGQVIPIIDTTGEIIKVIFDLSSMTITNDRYPLLYSHDDKAWVGSFNLINDLSKLTMSDFKLLDNSNAKMVINALKTGFPVKTSVRILPQNIDFVEQAEINGIPVKNTYVYKNSTISEVSVTAIPKDRNTSLNFTESGQCFNLFEVNKRMETIEKEQELQKKLAEKEKENATLQSLVNDFSLQSAKFEAQLKLLKAERDKFAEDAASMALEIRTKDIAELESMTGEFNAEQKEWLSGLQDDDFNMVSSIFKEKFETLKSEVCSAEVEEEVDIQPVEEAQMSQKTIPSYLFSHQAKNGKGKDGLDEMNAWIAQRNGVKNHGAL